MRLFDQPDVVRPLPGCGLLLLASLFCMPAFAQDKQPNLDLLVFDAVPLALSPADPATTPQAAGQPPYQASEVVTPPRTDPKPVAIAMHEQAQKVMPPAASADAADIQRREAMVKDMELSGDAYANGLSEVLLDLAGDYESIGDLLKARELYERANHVTRVNKGLFSVEQIPIIERLFNNYLMSGDLVAADQQQEYLYYLQRKVHAGDDANLINPLQKYAEWNVQAFLSYLPPALPESVTAPAGDAAAAEAPTPAPVASAVPDMVTFRIQHLINAQALYQQLIDLLLATTHHTDPRLPEAEHSLAVTSYLFAMQAPMIDPAMLSSSDAGFYSQMPMQRMGYTEGRRSMERRIEYLEQNESTPPADLARARLELADWMIATHSRSDFVEVFTNAYNEYVASGASAEEIDTIFHPPLPIEVPTFLIRPHSRLSLGIPVEAALQYRGYIDVEYGVSKIGDSLSPKILFRTPETPEAVEEVLLRSLRRAEFRPRMQNGELLDNDKITARYYYTW